MLHALHPALQRLIWERGLISPDEVDITFEAPTRERIDRLTRPAINLFLFDLEENNDLRQTNWQVGRENGHATRHQPPRRVDLRYMVSALTTEIEDEHALLWRTLVTLLKYPELPEELLPEAITALALPVATKVNPGGEGRRLLDLWSALGAPPRSALCYSVTVPVDLDLVISAPVVLTRTARYRRTAGGDAPTETRVHIGGVVRTREGAALAGVRVALVERAAESVVTDAAGRYTLRNVPQGEVPLSATLPTGVTWSTTVMVPSDDYDILVEDLTAAAPHPVARGAQRSRKRDEQS